MSPVCFCLKRSALAFCRSSSEAAWSASAATPTNTDTHSASSSSADSLLLRSSLPALFGHGSRAELAARSQPLLVRQTRQPPAARVKRIWCFRRKGKEKEGDEQLVDGRNTTTTETYTSSTRYKAHGYATIPVIRSIFWLISNGDFR